MITRAKGQIRYFEGSYICWCVFFFFQAEDGIRDLTVTGVQTCALPIWRLTAAELARDREPGAAPAAQVDALGQADQLSCGQPPDRPEHLLVGVQVETDRKSVV